MDQILVSIREQTPATVPPIISQRSAPRSPPTSSQLPHSQSSNLETYGIDVRRGTVAERVNAFTANANSNSAGYVVSPRTHRDDNIIYSSSPSRSPGPISPLTEAKKVAFESQPPRKLSLTGVHGNPKQHRRLSDHWFRLLLLVFCFCSVLLLCCLLVGFMAWNSGVYMTDSFISLNECTISSKWIDNFFMMFSVLNVSSFCRGFFDFVFCFCLFFAVFFVCFFFLFDASMLIVIPRSWMIFIKEEWFLWESSKYYRQVCFRFSVLYFYFELFLIFVDSVVIYSRTGSKSLCASSKSKHHRSLWYHSYSTRQIW